MDFRTSFLPLVAAFTFAAPAHALTESQGYAAGVLWGTACAISKGADVEYASGIGAEVAHRRNIPASHFRDPEVIAMASRLYETKGCR
jgi:hypothetical protein